MGWSTGKEHLTVVCALCLAGAPAAAQPETSDETQAEETVASELSPELEQAYDEGRLSEVLRLSESELKDSPDSFQLHWVRGVVLRQIADYPAAVTHLERAVQLNPEEPEAWAELAWARWAGRDGEGARAAAKTALDLAPELESVLMIVDNLETDARIRSKSPLEHPPESTEHYVQTLVEQVLRGDLEVVLRDEVDGELWAQALDQAGLPETPQARASFISGLAKSARQTWTAKASSSGSYVGFEVNEGVELEGEVRTAWVNALFENALPTSEVDQIRRLFSDESARRLIEPEIRAVLEGLDDADRELYYQRLTEVVSPGFVPIEVHVKSSGGEHRVVDVVAGEVRLSEAGAIGRELVDKDLIVNTDQRSALRRIFDELKHILIGGAVLGLVWFLVQRRRHG